MLYCHKNLLTLLLFSPVLQRCFRGIWCGAIPITVHKAVCPHDIPLLLLKLGDIYCLSTGMDSIWFRLNYSSGLARVELKAGIRLFQVLLSIPSWNRNNDLFFR